MTTSSLPDEIFKLGILPTAGSRCVYSRRSREARDALRRICINEKLSETNINELYEISRGNARVVESMAWMPSEVCRARERSRLTR